MAHPQVRGHILEDGLGNYLKFIVHSNPFLSADISRKPVLLCMVQNLSGFCFLFFYFSCFLRERGEEMDKITKLCTVFPVFYSRVQASMFYFTQSSLAAQSVQLQTILQWGAMHCFNVHCTYTPRHSGILQLMSSKNVMPKISIVYISVPTRFNQQMYVNKIYVNFV